MDKFQAEALGKEFLKKAVEATGGDWKLTVHENLGWHYALSYGRLNLYERRERDTGRFYYTMLVSNNNKRKTAGAGYYPMVKGYDIDEVVATNIIKVHEIEKERLEFAEENFSVFKEEKLKETVSKMIEHAK